MPSVEFLVNHPRFLKKGWLFKQGGSVKTVKKRFCVLCGDELYYFKSEEDEEDKGNIKLKENVFRTSEKVEAKEGAIFSKALSACIEIPSEVRTYKFWDVSSSSADEWANAINDFLTKLRQKAAKPFDIRTVSEVSTNPKDSVRNLFSGVLSGSLEKSQRKIEKSRNGSPQYQEVIDENDIDSIFIKKKNESPHEGSMNDEVVQRHHEADYRDVNQDGMDSQNDNSTYKSGRRVPDSLLSKSSSPFYIQQQFLVPVSSIPGISKTYNMNDDFGSWSRFKRHDKENIYVHESLRTKMWIVGSNDSETGKEDMNGTLHPMISLDQAICDSLPGDTIKLKNGKHMIFDTIFLNKEIHLIGEKASDQKKNKPQTEIILVTHKGCYKPVICTNSSYASIENIILKASPINEIDENQTFEAPIHENTRTAKCCLQIRRGQVRIDNVHMQVNSEEASQQQDGLFVSGHAQVKLNKCSIRDCRYGYCCSIKSKLAMFDCKIEDVVNIGYGIHESYTRIVNTKIKDVERKGISVCNMSELHMSKSIIKHCGGNFISGMDQSKIIIEECQFKGFDAPDLSILSHGNLKKYRPSTITYGDCMIVMGGQCSLKLVKSHIKAPSHRCISILNSSNVSICDNEFAQEKSKNIVSEKFTSMSIVGSSVSGEISNNKSVGIIHIPSSTSPNSLIKLENNLSN